LDLTCAWDKEEFTPRCGTVEWIIAYMCDRCNNQAVTEICDTHYRTINQPNPPQPRISCGHCHGTISYSTRKLTGEQGTEIINT
jgi:hypothetical protein